MNTTKLIDEYNLIINMRMITFNHDRLIYYFEN